MEEAVLSLAVLDLIDGQEDPNSVDICLEDTCLRNDEQRTAVQWAGNTYSQCVVRKRWYRKELLSLRLAIKTGCFDQAESSGCMKLHWT